MPPAGDELNRWAREQAPDLLARAEAEAVAMLRDALVEAALAKRADARRAAPSRADGPLANAPLVDAPRAEAPRAEAPPAHQGELIWTYCVLGASAPQPPDLTGVDDRFPVERIQAGGLAALVSRVPAAEFDAGPLRENLNDLNWLERVARAHEAVLEAALAQTTIVPLRLCTLYEDADGVRRMLTQEHPALDAALRGLVGREEWGFKFFVDPSKLDAEVRTSDEVAELSNELEGQSGGGAYMLGRRLERHVREASATLAGSTAADVRATLESRRDMDVVMRPPQNRELSGHEGEMLANAACLVDAAGLEGLRQLAAEVEDRYAPLGARVELTGPWPPYNFVPGGDTAALA